MIPKTAKKMTTTKAAPKTTTAQTTTTVTMTQVPLSTIKTTLNRALKLRLYYTQGGRNYAADFIFGKTAA